MRRLYQSPIGAAKWISTAFTHDESHREIDAAYQGSVPA